MPLEADDQARVDKALEDVAADDFGTRVPVLNASYAQKLGFWTIICTVLNRAIGSGIFVTPAILLKATGSPGASLLLWTLGAITGMSALLVWLEFGLSIPKFELQNINPDNTLAEGESLQCVPRSGGEKNYLEYVYGGKDEVPNSTNWSKIRVTCMYGVIYITLGNLSGNAIAFGTYILEAAGINHGHDDIVRGLAVVCMTAACLVHATYRQGGIYIIIGMAVFKVCILLAIIGIGFAAMGGKTYGYGSIHGQTITDAALQTGPGNLGTKTSFAFASKDFSNYANSILFVIYTYSGNEQPFYVLSEVIQPKRIFAKATISAVSIVITLFMLVNIAYLGAVSYAPDLPGSCLSIKDSVNKYDLTQIQQIDHELSLKAGNSSYESPLLTEFTQNCKLDMATVFFSAIFGGETAKRVMSAIIAVSIFGNIVVMTFTASRVKQEIAKEGILPWSLFFARNTVTPWARFRKWWRPNEDYEPERSPSPALLLHWFFSMILIGASSARTADVAYQVLVSLYSYTIVILIGFFTASGLLYAKYFGEDGHWKERSGFKPFGGPLAAILYTLISAFLIVTPFVKPGEGSPFQREVSWYVIPTIGLSFLVLGYVYYLGLRYVVPETWHKGKTLVADREAIIIREKGEYVQYLEIVDATWEAKSGPTSAGAADMEMNRVSVVN